MPHYSAKLLPPSIAADLLAKGGVDRFGHCPPSWRAGPLLKTLLPQLGTRDFESPQSIDCRHTTKAIQTITLSGFSISRLATQGYRPKSGTPPCWSGRVGSPYSPMSGRAFRDQQSPRDTSQTALWLRGWRALALTFERLKSRSYSAFTIVFENPHHDQLFGRCCRVLFSCKLGNVRTPGSLRWNTGLSALPLLFPRAWTRFSGNAKRSLRCTPLG
jgi:hypothetical protein